MGDHRIPGLQRLADRKRRERLNAERSERELRRANETVAKDERAKVRQRAADQIERNNALSDVLSRYSLVASGAFLVTGFVGPVLAPNLLDLRPPTDTPSGTGVEPRPDTLLERAQNGDVWLSFAISLIFLLVAVFATRLKKAKLND